MATPVGHYLVGLSIGRALARDHLQRRQALGIAAVALLADLDVLPGLVVGDLSRYHHQATHSLAAAVGLSAIVLVALLGIRSRRAFHLSSLVLLVYGSHLALDFFTLDTSEPYGFPAFWPWGSATYEAPFMLLPNVQHTISPLFSVHNALLMVREVLIFVPLAGLSSTAEGLPLPRPKRAAWLYGGWFLAALGVSALSLR